MKKVNAFVLKIQEWILIICGVAMFSLLTTGAALRYLLHTDFYGLEEIVMIFGFWLYFTGSAYAGYEDSHISADMFTAYMKSDRHVSILKIVRHTVSLVVCIIADLWCLKFVLWNLQTGPTTPVFDIPLVVMQLPIPISFFLLTIYTIMHLYIEVNVLRDSGTKNLRKAG